ncbi:serine/threonine-protein kinase [Streptomyces sp. NPDC048018]|uniref:serine/threonine-protein kinase n=1 Tax=Streptomyces sp. NPDC048018 TaxID=3365499 RepID=UPI0037132309
MKSVTEVFQPLETDDPVQVGGYRLAARLGAGGMGRVYLSHTRGGRPVAIKVVRPELADDPDFRRRFRREMEAARRVRGAYTAELIDGDAEGAPPWLATLYVPGPSLAEAVARNGPLPVPAVLWLLAGVAEALQAIHGVGVVHRDLKPANVLLAADGPRVIDFGISLASGISSHTATGAAVGTPSFMAPEQASAAEVTQATDIFALGQTAAFAALGRPLYGDGPGVSVLYRIVHSEPDLSQVPDQLRPLLARCLAADPADRVTAAEVVDRCRRLLGADLEAGVGPAAWREVKGPDPEIPPPVAEPTPLHVPPLGTWPYPPDAAAPASGDLSGDAGDRRARRRRTALVTAAAVTAAALALTGMALQVGDVFGRLADRAAQGPSTGAKQSPGPSASAGAASAGPGTGSDAPGSTASASGGPSAQPTPEPHQGVFLDEKSSLGIRDGERREDRKGDLRLVCDPGRCELQSDSSVMVQLFGQEGNGYDMCRMMLRSADQRSWPMASLAAGSRVCVRHPSGDIALFVVQVKSTYLPETSSDFVTADVTIWRHAFDRRSASGR